LQTEAIILAGGLGTRLRSVVADLPKCMAPVAGKPFLHYVIQHLQNQGITKFIFSLGYLSEVIEEFLSTNYPLLSYQIVIENEPLGTGGAIKLACEKSAEKNVLILNGDTLFAIDTKQLLSFHEQQNAACTLSLKPMQNFDRYGVVELGNQQNIISFQEKKYYQSGLINGGVYALDAAQFLKEELPEKFSFEKDYLEKKVVEQKIFGILQDQYFIDIGIPADFERAQREFANVQI
jgi:D-glycero-alpha-D-manno-heptose 1-phosphate guanylyltransferase